MESGQPRRVHALSVDFHALPRDAAPQLPAIHRGTTHFADWNVDSDDRAALAGLQADGIRGAAGRVRICKPSANAVSFLNWRVRRRPLRPSAQRDWHADGCHDSGVRACGADADAYDL